MIIITNMHMYHNIADSYRNWVFLDLARCIIGVLGTGPDKHRGFLLWHIPVLNIHMIAPEGTVYVCEGDLISTTL